MRPGLLEPGETLDQEIDHKPVFREFHFSFLDVDAEIVVHHLPAGKDVAQTALAQFVLHGVAGHKADAHARQGAVDQAAHVVDLDDVPEHRAVLVGLREEEIIPPLAAFIHGQDHRPLQICDATDSVVLHEGRRRDHHVPFAKQEYALDVRVMAGPAVDDQVQFVAQQGRVQAVGELAVGMDIAVAAHEFGQMPNQDGGPELHRRAQVKFLTNLPPPVMQIRLKAVDFMKHLLARAEQRISGFSQSIGAASAHNQGGAHGLLEFLYRVTHGRLRHEEPFSRFGEAADLGKGPECFQLIQIKRHR